MIIKEEILKLAEEALTETQFVVDVKINNANDIFIFIDDFKGLTIEECKRISRYIEANLDRENEDFSLEVSSPGLSNPFIVKKQYLKNLNKDIEILTKEGKKVIGKLINVEENYITIETTSIKKIENKKQEIKESDNIEFDYIKTAKNIISFK